MMTVKTTEVCTSKLPAKVVNEKSFRKAKIDAIENICFFANNLPALVTDLIWPLTLNGYNKTLRNFQTRLDMCSFFDTVNAMDIPHKSTFIQWAVFNYDYVNGLKEDTTIPDVDLMDGDERDEFVAKCEAVEWFSYLAPVPNKQEGYKIFPNQEEYATKFNSAIIGPLNDLDAGIVCFPSAVRREIIGYYLDNYGG